MGAQKELCLQWELLAFDLPPLTESLLSEMVDFQWETFLVTYQIIFHAELLNNMKGLTQSWSRLHSVVDTLIDLYHNYTGVIVDLIKKCLLSCIHYLGYRGDGRRACSP